MPNHIQNRLKIVGDQQKVKEVFQSIKSFDEESKTEVQIDFNKIIPMPKNLDIRVHSGIEDAVKASLKMPCNENKIIAALEMRNREKTESPLTFDNNDWEIYIKCLNNVRAYGFVYWYDWSIENWGTKWNAYSQNDERNTGDTIYFQTAWSAPTKLMIELSQKFPDVRFLFDYADEDTGSNTGKYIIENGQVISCIVPRSLSKEGFEIYFDLHPNTINDYKFIDGKYVYNDEEE